MHSFKRRDYVVVVPACLFFLFLFPRIPNGAAGATSNTPSRGHGEFAPAEEAIREELGIPPEAEKVAIFSMSSHWDPDWLATFEMYYILIVEKCITEALDLLDLEERYYYSISEIVFLRRYWEDHSEDRARIGHHIDRGHLRIVGGGMTSPDTLLPSGESLMRDWLYGNQWTMENLGIKPVTAWQPDSFGHTPSLPGILTSLGYRYVSFARVDSNTSAFLRSQGSADFVWEGLDGEEVLAHWMVGFYGQGDTIDTDFIMAPYCLAAFGIDPCPLVNPAPEFTNPRIQGYLDSLDPVSPTGYMFIPVGSDFAFPNPNLVTYMDNWNSMMFEETGVWCAAATFEHYAMLVDAHREELPSFQRDINPYWTGFYTTRPVLKDYNQWCTSDLTAVEIFSVLAGSAGYSYPEEIINDAWDGIVFMNHHDGITGTSLDYVYYQEQIPMGEEALELSGIALEEVIGFLADHIDTSGATGTPIIVFNSLGFQRTDVVRTDVFFDEPGVSSVSVIDDTGEEIPSQLSVESWHDDGSPREAVLSFIASDVPSLGYSTYSMVTSEGGDENDAAVPSGFVRYGTPEYAPEAPGELIVESDLFSITFSSFEGWCITSLIDRSSGEEYISGIGNDLIYYLDVGGLYRIGEEANPGSFNPLFRASGSIGMLDLVEEGPVYTKVNIRNLFPLMGRNVIVYRDLPRIEFEANAATVVETSLTARFETTVVGAGHRMGIPFGEVGRPSQSVYDPTFWPGKWVVSSSDAGDLGFAMMNLGGRGWHFDDEGTVEVMLERHSFFELGGFEGAFGSDREVPLLRYAIIPHDRESWEEGRLVREMLSYETPLLSAVTDNHEGELPGNFSLAWSDDPDIWIQAVKKAEASDDIILRIFRTGDETRSAVIRTALTSLTEIHEVSAAETDPAPYPDTPSEFMVYMPIRSKTFLLGL